MRRLSRLALPWAARVPAMLCGAAVSRPAAAAMRAARTAALCEMRMRACALRPKAVACLHAVPWRADLAAVVPSARGICSGAWCALAGALERPPRAGGVLAAATAGSVTPASGSAMGPSLARACRRLPPFAASLVQLRCFLHEALLRRWCSALWARRKDFGAGPASVDFGTMRRLAAVGRHPDDAATLRVVLSGAALPRVVAAR